MGHFEESFCRDRPGLSRAPAALASRSSSEVECGLQFPRPWTSHIQSIFSLPTLINFLRHVKSTLSLDLVVLFILFIKLLVPLNTAARYCFVPSISLGKYRKPVLYKYTSRARKGLLSGTRYLERLLPRLVLVDRIAPFS